MTQNNTQIHLVDQKGGYLGCFPFDAGINLGHATRVNKPRDPHYCFKCGDKIAKGEPHNRRNFYFSARHDWNEAIIVREHLQPCTPRNITSAPTKLAVSNPFVDETELFYLSDADQTSDYYPEATALLNALDAGQLEAADPELLQTGRMVRPADVRTGMPEIWEVNP